jgi:hypothetical protein
MRTPQACSTRASCRTAKLQVRGEPLLLASRSQLQGGQDQTGEGTAGGQVLGLPWLGVGAGESSVPTGPWRWRTGTHDHLATTDEMGRVRITFAVDAAGLGVNTIGPLFAGIYARKPGGNQYLAY